MPSSPAESPTLPLGEAGPLETDYVTRLADPARLEAMRRTELFATPPEVAFDRITRMAACALKCPIAGLGMVDDKHFSFKSLLGVPEPWASARVVSLETSIAQHVIQSGKPLVICDAREEGRWDNAAATRLVGAIAYLGVPLLTSDDLPIGVLAVLDHRPRNWSSEDVQVLEDAAGCIMSEIELRQNARTVRQLTAAAARDLTMQFASIVSAQRDIMACGPDLSRVMQLTAERAQEVTLASAAAVELRDGDDMVYKAATGSAHSALGLRLRVDSSLSGACVLSGKTLLCTDCETDPRVDRDACRRVSARSLLVVPLRFKGETVGVLKVMSPNVEAFQERAVATLEFMAGFIAAAMAYAEASVSLQTSEQKFRSLAELASDAIVTADAAGLITFWNASAVKIFGYSGEQVLGTPLARLMPQRFAADHTTALGRYRHEQPSKVINKTIELSGRRANGDEFPLELSVSSWQRDQETFFTGIIRDITERKELQQAVLDLARTDHLTGLLTRGPGEQLVCGEVARASRYARPLSFALFDLDHFKHVNDRFGHAAGDGVLRAFGKLILARQRASDVGVRWGGEELLVMLPETGLEGAATLSDRIRAQLAELTFEAVGRVTASVGVAELSPGETADQAIARADANLYTAKSSGRNRVSA